MTRLRGMTFAAALVAGLTIPAVSLAAPASADPAGNGPWQTYYEGPFSEIQEDFCDVPGLTVEFTYADAIRERWRILGPDDSPYNMYFADGYQKYTNVATGESVTLVGAGSYRRSGRRTTATAPTRSTRPTRATPSGTPTTAKFSAASRARSATPSCTTTTAPPAISRTMSRSRPPPSSGTWATKTTTAQSWSAPSANSKLGKRSGEPTLEHPLRSLPCVNRIDGPARSAWNLAWQPGDADHAACRGSSAGLRTSSTRHVGKTRAPGRRS